MKTVFNEEQQKLFGKAAEAGNPGAMDTLGYFYEKGISVEQNSEKAHEWYGKATAAR